MDNKPMARVATEQDYYSGKLLFYWGDYYHVWSIIDGIITLVLPGKTPNSWHNPTGRWLDIKPTSVQVKINSPQILVID